MKKTGSILLVLMFCMVPLLAEPCGDVNSNGIIDIVDASMTAHYYLDLDPQPYDVDAADVSGDGNINITDALQTARYYIGLITELQGCLPGPTSPPVPTAIPDPDAPPGYTWCANEGDTVTFDYLINIAYGAEGRFYYYYDVSGTITFDNNTFGDPIYGGVEKKGYYQPAGPNPTLPPTPAQSLIGDVDGDVTINILDALKIAQYTVGLAPAGFIVANADTNCSGNIDIVDALIIAQYAVGLISRFC